MTIIIKHRTVFLTLSDEEDFVLSDYLVRKGIVKNDVHLTLPANRTIGGTIAGAYAFTSGDLTAYGKVTLVVNGSIIGKGGAANGGHAGHAIHSDSDNLFIENHGLIAGGGGGGGKGGDGGEHSYFPAHVWQEYANHNDRLVGQASSVAGKVIKRCGYQKSWWRDNDYIRICNGSKGYNKGSPLCVDLNLHKEPTGSVYKDGGHSQSDFYDTSSRGADRGWQRGLRTICTTSHKNLVKNKGANGSNGGTGQGYKQGQEAGNPATAPGGAGGAGATYGLKGVDGGTGGTGTIYQFAYKGAWGSGSDGHYAGFFNQVTTGGHAGGVAGNAGKAISGAVTYTNNGTIIGDAP